MRARGLTSALWASIDARARDGGAEGDAFDARDARGGAATTKRGSGEVGTATTATTATTREREETTDDLELCAAR